MSTQTIPRTSRHTDLIVNGALNLDGVEVHGCCLENADGPHGDGEHCPRMPLRLGRSWSFGDIAQTAGAA